MRVLVTGANRGIGLALVQAHLAKGHEVVATCRSREALARNSLEGGADRLRWKVLDVSDVNSCKRLAQELENLQIDVLYNNAGVGSRYRPLGELDTEEVARIIDVNAVGPLRVTQALLPLILRSKTKLVYLTSLMGSIADNRSGHAWGYRMSKAALNMLVKNASIELREEGVVAVAVHPGWVKTEMGGPEAPLTPEQSAQQILLLAERISMQDTGKFLDAMSGRELPW